MALNGKDRITNIEQSGTNAERLALDTSLIKQATEFYETDTTARYKWMSGAWVPVTLTGGAAPGYGGSGGVSPANPITSISYTYSNGLMQTMVETIGSIGKSRTTTYSYNNGLLSGTTIGNWV